MNNYTQTEIPVEVNKVYVTNDLSIFKFTKFNRNVSIRKEMLEQAKERFISPVVVNEHMVVIDGQHRIEHAKIANVPVEYIIKSGLGERDIVRMNTTQKPWSLLNYIESFANQGNENYVKLLQLINKRFIDTSVVIATSLGYSHNGSLINEKIKEGKFEFFNYEKELEFLHLAQEFKEKLKFPNRSKVNLALYKIFQYDQVDWDRLVRKMKETNQDEELRVKSPNQVEAMKMIIDANNHHIMPSSPYYIPYHVTNAGEFVIDLKKSDWAIKLEG